MLCWDWHHSDRQVCIPNSFVCKFICACCCVRCACDQKLLYILSLLPETRAPEAAAAALFSLSRPQLTLRSCSCAGLRSLLLHLHQQVGSWISLQSRRCRAVSLLLDLTRNHSPIRLPNTTMDFNWCNYCEKQLDATSEDPDFSDPDEADAARQLAAHQQEVLPKRTLYPGQQQQQQHAAPPLRRHGQPVKQPKANVKRNQSSGKLGQLKASHGPGLHSKNGSSSSLHSPTLLPQSPLSKKPSTLEIQPWTGLYCSAECMEKEEQRSRLAIADLDMSARKSPALINHRPTSNSSSTHSHRSSGSDELRSNGSSSSLHRYATGSYSLDSTSYQKHLSQNYLHPSANSTSSLAHASTKRTSRPPPMNLSNPSLRTRSYSRDRGSSDSLTSLNFAASSFQPSPTSYASLRPNRSGAGFRSMVPLGLTLDEMAEHATTTDSDDEERRPSTSNLDTSSKSPSSALPPNTAQEGGSTSLRPFPATTIDSDGDDKSLGSTSRRRSSGSSRIDARRPSRRVSVASTTSRSGSGLLPSSSLAGPVLSQGTEGNAVGTLIGSPKNDWQPSSWSSKGSSFSTMHRANSGSFQQKQRPAPSFPRLRTDSSIASVPQLSCSPSSPDPDAETSSLSGKSARSSTSTPPSEHAAQTDYLSCKRLSNPHAHTELPRNTTLHDYALFHNQRPTRTPSLPHLPTLGSSPRASPSVQPSSPAPYTGPKSHKESSSSGVISQIVQASAHQRFSIVPASEPQQTALSSCVADESRGILARAPSSTEKASRASLLKSSSSVVSLPHHSDEFSLPMSRSPNLSESPATATLRASSAPKGWTWEGSQTPQYRAMQSKASAAATGGPATPDFKKKRLFYFDSHHDD